MLGMYDDPELYVIFWYYKSNWVVAHDTFSAKPWAMMVWINGGIRY